MPYFARQLVGAWSPEILQPHVLETGVYGGAQVQKFQKVKEGENYPFRCRHLRLDLLVTGDL
jgi:hypothetical protein